MEGLFRGLGAELELEIVFHGVAQPAVAVDLPELVGGRSRYGSGVSPVDHVLVDGDLGLQLNLGVDALAV
ncbi:hypothetical protein SDC9_184713 [bioreactor metagenome]|uniref:Uncharacterized protein n=1 Tax=bioreactor metagenome TaxID=1076179 RepID=A0A645HDT6_9ZZZZ